VSQTSIQLKGQDICVSEGGGLCFVDPSLSPEQFRSASAQCAFLGESADEFFAFSHAGAMSFDEMLGLLDDPAARRRGCFVTPLMEDGILRLGGRRLVVVTDQPVPDWGDWAEQITSVFGPITHVALSSRAEALSCTKRIDVAEIDHGAGAGVVREGDSNPASVTLRVDSGELLVPPAGFVGTGTGAQRTYCRETSLPVAIRVEPSPDTGDLGVSIEVSRDRTIIASESVTVPGTVSANEHIEVGEDDARAIRMAARALALGAGIPCPACGRSHRWERPFICDREGGVAVLACVDTREKRRVVFATGAVVSAIRYEEPVAISGVLVREESGSWSATPLADPSHPRQMELASAGVWIDTASATMAVVTEGSDE
jgi:hypothetical protein